ncbi:Fur family transcriptional regulator [Thalassotalea profundi]|uniref:ABC transporter ATP-binding protein n=1 Tax=Thalassotalea profundi TaxID=2036687 RepID=A0ABQ3J2N1_9GAMM|nr:transcriptional repressor [Thalassotalea profundi]GHF00670.1 ABC transporter ATP-binding protein [Thalassotalea profundi]
MNNVNTILEHAENSCKSHGARLTAKRKLVLSSLIQSEKALSAYDVIDLCKQEYNESIPAMSVYRILEFLETEKLVHKLKLANKYVACSHISCGHAHGVPQFLICGKCDLVKEISIKSSTMSELKNDVEYAGFQLASPQLEMNCICNNCVENAA